MMRIRIKTVQAVLGLTCTFAWLTGCGQGDSNLNEKENPDYQRGHALLRQGLKEEALDQFLQVLDEDMAPQTHLELGQLFLDVESRNDPVQAIYHLESFLRQNPDSREAENVKQLIATAEKQFLSGLAGRPYGDLMETEELRASNSALGQQVQQLKSRLSNYEEIPEEQISSGSPDERSSPVVDSSEVITPSENTYIVQTGDSLYVISVRFYGSPLYVEAIHEANRETMPSKDSLRVGQQLTLPKVARR